MSERKKIIAIIVVTLLLAGLSLLAERQKATQKYSLERNPSGEGDYETEMTLVVEGIGEMPYTVTVPEQKLTPRQEKELIAAAKEELAACRRILPLLGRLPLDTRLLTDGGRILGFSVMEKIGDTLMIHIEKGLPAVRGIYPMLVTLEANAYPDVRFVNREEDDGNEGLRRSKQSYHPVRLLQKYYAEIV